MAKEFERVEQHEGLIPILESPTAANFDSDGYLWANPDIAAAAGQAPSRDFALDHFLNFGHDEHRQQLVTNALPRVAEARRIKLRELVRRSPESVASLATHVESCCGTRVELLKVPSEPRLPVPYERISCNLYDPEIETWINDNPSSLFLDAGAGLRNVYRSNVVNAEIATFPSTDILCFGDSLPFDDDTFDGVMSFAVLEHVPDPFIVAQELVRVARPGARIIVDWPFLAPLHGYPHHYFNATPEGAREAFERIGHVEVVDSYIPLNFHPVFALRWILDEWQAGMSGQDRDRFLGLSVADILAAFDSANLSNPWDATGLRESWVTGLPKPAQIAISAGTRLVIAKT